MLFNGDTLGAHLADLGADVIKVESPAGGDYIRHFLGQITPGNSPAHVQINRGKRSVTIDLHTESGREVFWRLLRDADVFVDGNASDAAGRLGIGYEDQRRRKPDIIYCQYTGFGAQGPYSAIPTHGQMMDALAGAHPHMLGDDGLMYPGGAQGLLANMSSGGEGTAAGAIHAAYHVAAALFQRERTGEGAYIDVSGADGVIGQAWIAATYALNEHRITDRRTLPAADNGEPTGSKYQYYETKDGQAVLFCCIEDKFWRNFCSAVGDPALSGQCDPDGPGPVDFGADDIALRHELQRVFHTRTLAEWMTLAADNDFALGPAYRGMVEVARDPHIAVRDIVHVQEHPDVGEFTYIGEVGKVAGQPYSVSRPAPGHGEHTDEVLAEAGYGRAELDALRKAKVIR